MHYLDFACKVKYGNNENANSLFTIQAILSFWEREALNCDGEKPVAAENNL